MSEIAARTVFYILELIVSGAPRTPHGDHQLCVLHQNIVATILLGLRLTQAYKLLDIQPMMMLKLPAAVLR